VNTVLQARPRNFVPTPTVERVAVRALRYLQSGYSVHLKGPAGTGKTTLALHLADLLGRPIMLLFGDDEFKTSDLIGNQSGYTRKKVVDNFIHSVMKVEDELRHNWIDSRLTLACREGFTLVYDEFNRSRPEVNNVLLSALEEKLLVLPPSNNRAEYIRVSPHFRAIFTSNPEEYCGVHGTQDALQDRLITINMPEPDELAQQQILVQKVGIDAVAALQIVRLVKTFQTEVAPDMASSLRPSLIIATVCKEHGILPLAENSDFRDVCSDVLLDRSKLPLPEATRILWDIFNRFVASQVELVKQLSQPVRMPASARLHGEEEETDVSPEPLEPLVGEGEPREEDATPTAAASASEELAVSAAADTPDTTVMDPIQNGHGVTATIDPPVVSAAPSGSEAIARDEDAIEMDILEFLEAQGTAKLTEIEAALDLNRFQVVNALKLLVEQGMVEKDVRNHKPMVYRLRTEQSEQG
jgi:gas vesicle protein GvpN